MALIKRSVLGLFLAIGLLAPVEAQLFRVPVPVSASVFVPDSDPALGDVDISFNLDSSLDGVDTTLNSDPFLGDAENAETSSDPDPFLGDAETSFDPDHFWDDVETSFNLDPFLDDSDPFFSPDPFGLGPYPVPRVRPTNWFYPDYPDIRIYEGPRVISATVFNNSSGPIFCEGSVFGVSQFGEQSSAWFSAWIRPGGSGYANVMAVGFKYFTYGWPNIRCCSPYHYY